MSSGLLESGAAALSGCLTKLTHVEMRLMFANLRGHEFVRVYMQDVEVFDESKDASWLRRQTGEMIGLFFEAKKHLNRVAKYEVLRFYMCVVTWRMKVGQDAVSLQRMSALAAWEKEVFDETACWPWGEQIFTEKAFDPRHPTLLPQNGPKMVPEWSQNGPRMVPQWSKNGPEMVSEWSQNGPYHGPNMAPKLSPKWPKNGPKMVQGVGG